MIKSMTGFGSAEGTVGGARVSVEIRSVNHRFFNPSIKLPSELSKWEGDVRESLRRGVARGHVTLSARVERAAMDELTIDEARIEPPYANREAAAALQLPSGHGVLLRLPNVIGTSEGEIEGRRRVDGDRRPGRDGAR